MRIRRAVFVLAGAGMVLVGLAVLALSAPALAVVGFDDTLATGTQRLSSPTAAIASAEASLGDGDLPDRKRTAEEQWDLELRASIADRDAADGGHGDGGGELFLGIGPAEEVDAWLDEVAWDKVTVFSADGTDVRYDRLGAPGDPSDLPAPIDQDFWTVSEVGTEVALDWDYREGHYTIVLMNADGSAGVDADGSLDLEIPRLSLFLAVPPAFGFGAVLVGIVILLLVWRRARRDRQPATAAPADEPPTTPEVPGTTGTAEAAASAPTKAGASQP